MAKQLFPFNPIPHEQNQLTHVNGEVVIGRWATSVEDGKKVTIVFTNVCFESFEGLCLWANQAKMMDASWFPYESKFQ